MSIRVDYRLIRNRFIVSCSCVHFLVASMSTAAEPVEAPGDRAAPDTGLVLATVLEILSDRHVRQGIDPAEHSRRWGMQFILALDPMRMHFLQSDVDELMELAEGAIAEAADGRIDFPLRVVEVFRERLETNSKSIADRLQQRPDFGVEEKVRLKFKRFAQSQEETEERWRLRLKHELLVEDLVSPGSERAREFLQARYRRIHQQFESIEDSQFITIYIDTLARVFDPHSRYWDESQLAVFRI